MEKPIPFGLMEERRARINTAALEGAQGVAAVIMQPRGILGYELFYYMWGNQGSEWMTRVT